MEIVYDATLWERIIQLLFDIISMVHESENYYSYYCICNIYQYARFVWCGEQLVDLEKSIIPVNCSSTHMGGTENI